MPRKPDLMPMQKGERFVQSFDMRDEAEAWISTFSVEMTHNPSFAGWGVVWEPRLVERKFAVVVAPIGAPGTRKEGKR